MQLQVNGRDYAFPEKPLAVICLDGTDYRYIEAAVLSGQAPFLAYLLECCGCAEVSSAMPSLTNPNNISIVTGCPPSRHGICGNFFLDRQSGEAVMMNDPAFLRAGTILAAFARAGARVGAVTAKDKLRALLGHELEGICFSAENAASTYLDFSAEAGVGNGPMRATDFVGAPEPDVYSADVSLFVLRAGAALMQDWRPDILYLSTSDFIQHRHAPGTMEANTFFALLDPWLRRLDELGADLVITADHGMNAKTDEAGRPNCVFLGWLLDDLLGPGRARVILPITDPYVLHHGSLGGFAGIYLPDDILRDGARRAELEHVLSGQDGVEAVLTRGKACELYDLPPDRTADLVVLASPGAVLGDTPMRHDLGGIDWPLRSHGGPGESRVPMITNRRGNIPSDIRHNYDAFALGLNRPDL